MRVAACSFSAFSLAFSFPISFSSFCSITMMSATCVVEMSMSSLNYKQSYFDDVVDVDLAVLVVVEGLGDALQLVLWNVLDLPHDADQLADADEVFPEGGGQTAFRKPRGAKRKGRVPKVDVLHLNRPRSQQSGAVLS
ncbi:hypothetical protein EYF80_045634 [Liparis tanakae]|uniref:Uncharacterized protein n=1 Tax=Liparis tanakae TaxID=230148 RepID=A0A4Z2FTU6_9TELE|nr:hypothetical protein EYF80_045634 [Liparis tanakae]